MYLGSVGHYSRSAIKYHLTNSNLKLDFVKHFSI